MLAEKKHNMCEVGECKAEAVYQYSLFGKNPVKVCAACHFHCKREVIDAIAASR